MSKLGFILIFGFVCSASFAVEKATVKCKEYDKKSDLRVNMYFTGKKLNKIMVKELPWRGLPSKMVATADMFKKNSGHNSSVSSYYYDIALNQYTDEGFYYDSYLDISYAYKKDGKYLSLKESFEGVKHTIYGKPYGKIRMDINFPSAPYEYNGYSYFLDCKVK